MSKKKRMWKWFLPIRNLKQHGSYHLELSTYASGHNLVLWAFTQNLIAMSTKFVQGFAPNRLQWHWHRNGFSRGSSKYQCVPNSILYPYEWVTRVEWDNEGWWIAMNNTRYIIITINTTQLSRPIYLTMYVGSIA